MPVHIDEITSEVTAEPEPMGSAAEASGEGATFHQTLDQLARLAEDRRRVAAEGFDD